MKQWQTRQVFCLFVYMFSLWKFQKNKNKKSGTLIVFKWEGSPQKLLALIFVIALLCFRKRFYSELQKQLFRGVNKERGMEKSLLACTYCTNQLIFRSKPIFHILFEKKKNRRFDIKERREICLFMSSFQNNRTKTIKLSNPEYFHNINFIVWFYKSAEILFVVHVWCILLKYIKL